MKIPELLYKLGSYLYPIRFKTIQSDFSGQLELTWYNGKLLLDTENTNYSYGNLQKVLDKAIGQIDPEVFKTFKNTLILGVAGGSVIETLYTKYKYENTIDAVDIDPVILKIAEEEFKIKRFKKCHFFAADAFDFVKKSTKKYNFIIIDLFIDYQIPSFVFDESFINAIKEALNINGVILLNTIELQKKEKQNASDFIDNFKEDYKIKVLKNLEQHNHIYLIHKNKN